MRRAADQHHVHEEGVAVAFGEVVTTTPRMIHLRHIQPAQRRQRGPQHHGQEHPRLGLSRTGGDLGFGLARQLEQLLAILLAEAIRLRLNSNLQVSVVGLEVVGVMQDHLHLDPRVLDRATLLARDTRVPGLVVHRGDKLCPT